MAAYRICNLSDGMGSRTLRGTIHSCYVKSLFSEISILPAYIRLSTAEHEAFIVGTKWASNTIEIAFHRCERLTM